MERLASNILFVGVGQSSTNAFEIHLCGAHIPSLLLKEIVFDTNSSLFYEKNRLHDIFDDADITWKTMKDCERDCFVIGDIKFVLQKIYCLYLGLSSYGSLM